MKCPKCNSLGFIIWTSSDGYKHKGICNFCWDKKELDWIEVIFGVDFSYQLKQLNLKDKYEVSEM